ncbi:unnamed protein product [Clonostachys rosea f. rosea IK726]|uniref:Uncharacterized protein n=1 Tax=Clonostachys rosea f. rosea IK726 TaxID=1349383 RepID=A0ACA9TNY6_BIOOC|nr:unnamed protein product [Clonostachys rosea f. rosea IK726]
MASTVELLVGPSVLPVYNYVDNHAKMYWISSRNQVYWKTGYEHQIRVVELGKYTFALDFGPISWPNDLECPSGAISAVLQGHFQPENKSLESEPCTQDVQIECHVDTGFKCQGSFKAARQNLPWGLKGKIQWSLILSGYGDRRLQLAETDVELYFVAVAKLPKVLFRGMPVSFFRRFLLPLRLMTEDHDIKTFQDEKIGRNIRDNEQGWLDYVIDKLHHQPSIKYDSWASNNSYFQGGESPLAFDHWVNDCDEKAKHTLNCYDLAALVSVIVPLGITNPQHSLQMKHMAPFGYIYETNLIGWGPCNSPLTTRGSQVLGANDEKRTGFGSHIFMTISREPVTKINGPSEMVLDATCRPFTSAHSGRETLSQYITNSIDDKTDLYKRFPKRCTLGTFVPQSNPSNWAGPKRLFTQPEIFAPEFINHVPTESNILRNVKEQFKDWTVTEPNIFVQSTHLTAQWFFTSDDGETMSLSISRCATVGGRRGGDNPGSRGNAVDSAHELYTADLEKYATHGIDTTDGDSNIDEDVLAVWQSKSGDALKVDAKYHWSAPSDNEKGAMLWTQGVFFVKLTKDKKTDIAKYAQGVVDLIADVLKSPAPGVPELHVEVPDETTFKVGVVFDITVSKLPERMVPIDIDIYNSKVLYLSSSKSGDEVTFKFLAREVTDDEEPELIKFSAYDASMVKNKGGDHSVEITIVE